MNYKEFKKFARLEKRISSNNLDYFEKTIQNTTRSVIEERTSNFREIDVFSRLIMDRIIFFGTEVEENIANIVTAQLLFLESVDKKKDIYMYINSPGGSIYAGLSVYDTMQFISNDVNTICCSLAASFGAVLLTAGTKGKRGALKHSRIMIHQPAGGSRGQFSDMEITLKQMESLKKDLYKILSFHSGQSYERIEIDSNRDYWMTSVQAKEYGLIDNVLEKRQN
jgi:ATP-dependent Clp protease protease subunit